MRFCQSEVSHDKRTSLSRNGSWMAGCKRETMGEEPYPFFFFFSAAEKWYADPGE